MAKITDAVEILKRKMGIDPNTDPEMLQIAEDLRVAQMIYDARSEAGITQKELAQAVGTTQSVISQLESAEYKGHSLTMLERIAKALNRRVEIRLAPKHPVGPAAQRVVPRRLKSAT
jgi:ribosome-binding protein aMBF1 (putative translation factor)